MKKALVVIILIVAVAIAWTYFSKKSTPAVYEEEIIQVEAPVTPDQAPVAPEAAAQ